MTVLHFVRHGETDWNLAGRFQGVRDIALNPTGREQALRLATGFRPLDPVMVSSPLNRAYETASLLASEWKVTEIATDDLLTERAYGLAEGLTLDQRREQFPDGLVPNMETLDQVKVRAARFLSERISAWTNRTVVIVSHGGFINALLSWVSNGEVGSGKTLLANASVSTVHWDGAFGVVEAAGAVYGDVALSLRD